MKRLILAVCAAMLLAAPVEAAPKKGTAYTLVVNSAKKHGVPVRLALSVAHHETRISCGKWGDSGRSGGPLQIYYPTARSLGVKSYKSFRSMGCARLTDLGMRHLSMCWKLSKGNARAAARCHNGGPGATWSKRKKVNSYAAAVVITKGARIE